jgi:hypothetical protein
VSGIEHNIASRLYSLSSPGTVSPSLGVAGEKLAVILRALSRGAVLIHCTKRLIYSEIGRGWAAFEGRKTQDHSSIAGTFVRRDLLGFTSPA